MEDNRHINFLDLQLIRHNERIEIDIYRKPTTTNTTISNTSCHPNEQKLAAYRFYITRMLTLPLSPARQKT
jgi:pyridoxine 5'-phosphate synthase PdxJ